MATKVPEIANTSGEDMLALGIVKLHQDIARKVEAALGGSFPQMGVRFKHVSLSADLVAQRTKDKQAADPRDELSTLPNTVLKAFASCSSKAKTVRKEILNDVTGYFRPGTITLVLGQSGSGKSALIKLLSGRFPVDKSIALEGELLYNGVSRDNLLCRLPQFVNYISLTDTHRPTLTVRETLEFAHECGGTKLRDSAEIQLSHGSPEETSLAVNKLRSIFQYFPDSTLQSLGLIECQNTIVGNDMHRGISGGEKRRTTTGEMEFGLKYVTFMDEISTGLDSAAAFDIIAAQRSAAKRLHRTVIISLLQPSPEILSLFDDVFMLTEGRVMYHGPTSFVESYFESQGLVRPPKKGIADFFCYVTTPQQEQYEKGLSSTRKYPRFAREYADLWLQPPLYRQLEEFAEIELNQAQQDLSTSSKFVDDVPEFQQSFGASVCTLMKREAILIKRNDVFVKGRLRLSASSSAACSINWTWRTRR